LFNDIVGKSDNGVPEQIGLIDEKVGIVFGLTEILKVCDEEHCPLFGVKV